MEIRELAMTAVVFAPFCRRTSFHPPAGLRQLRGRTPKPTEQSENVYENKESSSREVKELRSWETKPGGWRSDADGLSLSILDFST
jgi:hypothetical protein